MAHTSCPSGHSMWNGDGKPVVYAFRINFFKDFVKKYPYFQLGNDEYLSQIYDCVDGIRGEDLDCWYCDECKGLVVFVDHMRYNFKIMDKLPEINMDKLLAWEEYIALRDHDFEEFQDYYEGMNPLLAIESYTFKYRYRVSPDKNCFYAINQNGKVEFGYYQSNYYEYAFYKRLKETDKDKFDINVHVNQYAYTWDDRTIQITEIIEKGKLYKGKDIDKPELSEVILKHEEIQSIFNHIRNTEGI